MKNKGNAVIVAFITFASLGLRLYQIGTNSFWVNEVGGLKAACFRPVSNLFIKLSSLTAFRTNYGLKVYRYLKKSSAFLSILQGNFFRPDASANCFKSFNPSKYSLFAITRGYIMRLNFRKT